MILKLLKLYFSNKLFLNAAKLAARFKSELSLNFALKRYFESHSVEQVFR